jgi:hypothetical protein
MHEASGPAGLLLKLYELRTEAALRDARSWFATTSSTFCSAGNQCDRVMIRRPTTIAAPHE